MTSTMERDAEKLCRCHGEPMLRTGSRIYCAVKRRASWRAGTQRYRATPHGGARETANRARRIYVGRTYHSRASSVEQAEQINDHIRKRLKERDAD